MLYTLNYAGVILSSHNMSLLKVTARAARSDVAVPALNNDEL